MSDIDAKRALLLILTLVGCAPSNAASEEQKKNHWCVKDFARCVRAELDSGQGDAEQQAMYEICKKQFELCKGSKGTEMVPADYCQQLGCPTNSCDVISTGSGQIAGVSCGKK